MPEQLLKNYTELDYRGLAFAELETKWNSLMPINKGEILHKAKVFNRNFCEACRTTFYDLWLLLTPDEYQSVIDRLIFR